LDSHRRATTSCLLVVVVLLLAIVYPLQFGHAVVVDPEHERYYLNNFIADIVDEKCKQFATASSKEEEQEVANHHCRAEMESHARSVKLANYFRRTALLDEFVGAMLNDTSLSFKRNMEGHTQSFFEKVKKMQELADDARVHTICEIGFNAGYSTFNFITANPHARVISFDLFEHAYTSPAVRGLHTLYPDRDIVVIAGASQQSVPRFARLFASSSAPLPRCNLIFIDGGHESTELYADIVNMRAFADPLYHRLLVDDVNYLNLFDTWRYFVGSAGAETAHRVQDDEDKRTNPETMPSSPPPFRVREIETQVSHFKEWLSWEANEYGTYSFTLNTSVGTEPRVESMLVVGEYLDL